MDYLFELIKASNSSGSYFWWRMKASNYKILSTSEVYTAKANAYRVVKKLMVALERGGAKVAYTFIDKS